MSKSLIAGAAWRFQDETKVLSKHPNPLEQELFYSKPMKSDKH